MQKTLTFGDISVQVFLEKYWQKKPLLIRQAFPDLIPLIPADELAGLACESVVESRLIIQEDKTWDLKHGPFNDEIFSDLPESSSGTNWTLLVQAVDHWIPGAAEFLQQFDFIPNWRVDDLMISYATDGGGVGPHYDNYDVFLIQAEGQRRWEIGGEYDHNSARRSDVPVLIIDQFQSEESWVLEPGDMLYLPPQVGHNGVAIGDGCMTYSVGFRAPSHSELLSSFSDAMADKLDNEDRYTDPDLQLQNNPGEITPQALQAIQKLLIQFSQDPELVSDWFGRFVTEPKYARDQNALGMQCTVKDCLDNHANGGLIARSEGSRFSYVKNDKGIILFVDGEAFECDQKSTFLVEFLCKELQFDLGFISENKAGLKLIGQLIEQGSLYPFVPD